MIDAEGGGGQLKGSGHMIDAEGVRGQLKGEWSHD